MSQETLTHFFDYSLSDILLEAIFNPRTAISPEIHRIDLGHFGLLSEKMIRRSLRDSHGRERGRSILLNKKGKLVTSQFDTIGSFTDDGRPFIRTSLRLDTKSDYLSKKTSRRTNLLVGFIHTHGHYDLPASPLDFYTLFGHIDTTRIALMEMVVTPERKLLYFRGLETPQWQNPDLSDQFVYWDNWLNHKINNVIDNQMTKKEQVGRIALQNYSFIKELKNNFGIRCFSCPLDRNIAIEDTA